MKLNLTARLVINEYIKSNNLNKKEVYNKLMPRYYKLVRLMEKNFDYGGSENPMAGSNISLMAGVFALWDISGRKLTVDDVLELFDKATPKKIPFLTDFLRNHFNLFAKIILKTYMPMARKVTAHKKKGEWKDAWGIRMKPLNPNEECICFDLIGCPVVAFAKKYGYMDIMPALCLSDFITPRVLGASLIRPKTVSTGYKYCNYKYIPDKK